MALNSRMTAKAFEILKHINNGFGGYNEWDRENPTELGILVDHPHGGGFESIVLQVRDITPEQLEYFNSRKDEIYNSSICSKLKEDPSITRIGWF